MIIHKDYKMADVIHLNYLVLPILNRFGIRLGFGDKTIEQVCREENVNLDFFLEIINAFNDTDYFPARKLRNFSIKLITDYLKKTHSFYLNVKIPLLENLVNSLVEKCSDNNRDKLLLVKSFFMEYKNELTEHIKREEEKIYPYVVDLEDYINNRQNKEKIIGKIKKNPISEYAKEHGNVEEKLFDLKNIIIKYIPSPKDINLCNDILFELFRLEKDLNDHQRIEDKVLVPKVKAMENLILTDNF